MKANIVVCVLRGVGFTALEMFFIDRAHDGCGAVEATAAGHHRGCGRPAGGLRHALGEA